MDLLDFIPFKNEFNKAYHGLTDNANHTSENPVFDALKVRRFAASQNEVSNFITEKIEHWVGWDLKSKKTSVGGMMMIRSEVSSFLLLGTKITVTFGLSEETDRNGYPITTINSKAETNIESRGDLGESRRVIRMGLSALDFEFRKQHVKDDEYLFRSLDPKGQNQALQELFDNARLKTKPSEEKRKPSKQAIPFRPSVKTNGTSQNTSDAENSEASDSMTASGNGTRDQEKPARSKVKVIKLKK
ncbi:MAG: hypothetical protein ISR54_10190 [Chlorobium phaeobacteroides]|uniref:Uncharacterized protein n=1 Tax=Chlorobium phaeobacteroides (strain BS1) TaxID=331678 RepID=B3EJF6_CHLPB|nr:hypothetical protein [Chlorobium phaeobacteroides]NEX14299.1 hypothetical protein [Prosthecochloris sp.]